MRAEYRKVLLKLFDDKLCQIAPEFKYCKTDIVSNNQRLYQWSVSNDCRCFIILSMSPKALDESFSLHVGWSNLKRMPEAKELFTPIYTISQNKPEFERDACSIKLGLLYAGTDVWWNIDNRLSELDLPKDSTPLKIDEAAAALLVNTALAESFDKLIEYGLPLLYEYVKSRSKI